VPSETAKQAPRAALALNFDTAGLLAPHRKSHLTPLQSVDIGHTYSVAEQATAKSTLGTETLSRNSMQMRPPINRGIARREFFEQ